MPLDFARRLITPLRDPVPTSRYPQVAPLLEPALRGLPQIDPGRCDDAGACARACPTGAIQTEPSGAARAIDAGRCIFCAACVIACPGGAVRMGSRTELARQARAELVEPVDRTATPIDSAANAVAEAADRARARIHGRFGRSLHVRHLDAGSCNGCDWEIAALLNPYHDIQRLGIDFVASPRHADLLLVTGVATVNLAEAARRTYAAMPDPRLVVAVGACAVSGGVFAGSPQAPEGVAAVLPVNVFVPGCPTRPEAIIEGILMAMDSGRAAGTGSAER